MKVLVSPDFRIANPYQKSLTDSLIKQGVQVRFGIRLRIRRCTFSPWFSVLISVLLRGKPDVLHLHWTHPFILGRSRLITLIKARTFIAELFLLKIAGIKIVWTIHNIADHESPYPSIERSVMLHFVHFCNAIIVHSAAAKDAVLQEYKLPLELQRHIHIIPHGHYIGSYRNEIERIESRTKLNLSQDNVVFLHLGQIRDYKGIPELIEAFRQIPEKRVRLLIAGRPQNHSIQQHVNELATQDNRIHVYWGFIPDNEIQVYMNAADAVVLPYRDILTSGGAILAMSFGKPIIAPALGCIPDVLDNEGSFLYDPSHANGLLEAMQLALDADLKKMGEHNFELAKKLSWDDIAKRTYEVYQSVMN